MQIMILLFIGSVSPGVANDALLISSPSHLSTSNLKSLSSGEKKMSD